MSRGNLVPKQIINANGVQTTVYVNPEQSQNLERNPLRGLGAPQTVSRDAEGTELPPREYVHDDVTLEEIGLPGIPTQSREESASAFPPTSDLGRYAQMLTYYQNRPVMDETGLQDLPPGASEEAQQKVYGWGEEWRDRNRIHYVGVEDDTTSLPKWMMNKGLQESADARDRGDALEAQLWERYASGVVQRAVRGELHLKDAKTGLRASWRRRFPLTFQGRVVPTPEDTDVISRDARHIYSTTVEIDGKQYDLTQEDWEAPHMAWEKPGPVNEAI